MAVRFRRLPGIRTLLLATYLAVLLLPIAGIGILRLYESALIRQTEAELLAQSAALSAVYRETWLERAPPGALSSLPKIETQWAGTPAYGSTERWNPLLPQLDLADTEVMAPPADPVPAAHTSDPVGRSIAPTLTAVVDNVQQMTLAGIRIVDPWGTIVVSTAKIDADLSLAGQEEVAYALRGAPKASLRQRIRHHPDYGWDSLSRNTELRVFVAIPILAEGHVLGAVIASRTPRDIKQTLYNKRFALLETALILVAAVFALAWFTGLTVVRPTRQLAAMARRVASGEGKAVVPLSAPVTREAQSLSDSIVTVAQALEARADYVRDLALGLSHELKTPLTGIRGSAELLRDHLAEMSAEERHRFLSNILADTERLEKLVRGILELARADSLVLDGKEGCDVSAASRRIAGGRRRVAVTAMPSTLQAAIDPASFEIVLSSLLENALQHGGSEASMAVSGRIEGGRAVIDVSDDGIGVSAANAERIFDRFFTTARDSGGTGLGLAIARQRVAAFGGDVGLVPSARGATFRIRLRLRR
jgi:signal transduction histidine kinase